MKRLRNLMVGKSNNKKRGLWEGFLWPIGDLTKFSSHGNVDRSPVH